MYLYFYFNVRHSQLAKLQVRLGGGVDYSSKSDGVVFSVFLFKRYCVWGGGHVSAAELVHLSEPETIAKFHPVK